MRRKGNTSANGDSVNPLANRFVSAVPIVRVRSSSSSSISLPLSSEPLSASKSLPLLAYPESLMDDPELPGESMSISSIESWNGEDEAEERKVISSW